MVAVVAPASAHADGVTVYNAIPFAAVAGRQVVEQRLVDFGDAGDAAGSCVGASYTVRVDWGDGTAGGLEIDKVIKIDPGHAPGLCSYGASGTHTYDQAGRYEITV